MLKGSLKIMNNVKVIIYSTNEENFKSSVSKAEHKLCTKEMGQYVMDAAKLAGCVAEADMPYVIALDSGFPFITAETIKAALEYHISKNNKSTAIVSKDNIAGYVLNSDIYKESALPTEAEDKFEAPEMLYISTRVDLAEAEKIMQKSINEKLMLEGVTIHSPETVIISPDAEVGKDTEIFANVVIEGASKIGENVLITSTTKIVNSEISNGVSIQSSVILDSKIGENTTVGPFAYVRPNCVVGANARIGDFVELKNCNIGNGTKVSHLTYVGDADVGEKCNFGCGTVTVNYDGKKKYRTVIGNNVFVGCNSNLVAPVTLNDGAYTAAGSTITDEVPENNLAIARARQINKSGWNDRRNG